MNQQITNSEVKVHNAATRTNVKYSACILGE